jgi:DNA-binding MltR family transcriptional regulator
MSTSQPDRLGLRAVADELMRRSHASTVIACTALLDAALEVSLAQVMRPLSKSMRADLFDPMRPLGSLAAKISLAHALRIVDRDCYRRLQKIRAIRNKFAHSEEPIDFSSPSIKPLVEQLISLGKPSNAHPDGAFAECASAVIKELSAFERKYKPTTSAAGTDAA